MRGFGVGQAVRAIPCPCHEIASSKTPRNDTFGEIIPVTILTKLTHSIPGTLNIQSGEVNKNFRRCTSFRVSREEVAELMVIVCERYYLVITPGISRKHGESKKPLLRRTGLPQEGFFTHRRRDSTTPQPAMLKDRNRNNVPIWEQMSWRGFAKQSPASVTRLLRRRLLAMTVLGKLFRFRS